MVDLYTISSIRFRMSKGLMKRGLNLPFCPNLRTPIIEDTFKSLIDYLKLQVSMPHIGVTLLSTLNCVHSYLNPLYGLIGDLDYLYSQLPISSQCTKTFIVSIESLK